MSAFVTAGCGFLLAVLWFDLMFDVQARGPDAPDGDGLVSIAAYYRRVTLQAHPMNRLVALVMLGTVAALVVQLAAGDAPRWASGVSLALVLAACGLALGHTFANGARLGGGRQAPERQRRLAKLMLRDHLLCLPAIATVIVVQLAFAT